MSKEYQQAIAKNNAAIAAFKAVQQAYRSMQIDDDKYFEAREDYEEAMAEFDVAFAKEAEVNLSKDREEGIAE